MDSKKLASLYSFDKRLRTLFELLDRNPTDKYQNSPAEKEWTVIQVLDHLYVSQQGPLNYCKKKIKAGDAIPESGLFDAIKMKVYLLFLFSPIKFKAPKVVSNPSNDWEYNEIKTKHLQFLEDLKDFVEAYPDKFSNKAIYKHPIAGRITMDHTISFFEAHLRHHQFQINRLLKYYNAK